MDGTVQNEDCSQLVLLTGVCDCVGIWLFWSVFVGSGVGNDCS